MKRHTIYIIIAALILIGGLLYRHQIIEARKQARADQTITVSTAPVIQKNVTVTLKAIGTVQPYASVAVTSMVSGQILNVAFTQGQTVHKDQPLFFIDPRPFQVALQQAQAALVGDQAKLQEANNNLKRDTTLYKKGYVSAQDYDTSLANQASLAATVQADQAAVANAQLNLNYCTIRAPIDGVTGNLIIYPGNLVHAGDTNPLVIINQIVPSYVSFSVPEQSLANIRSELTKGPIAVSAMINGNSNNIPGTLNFINNTVDTTTGTIELKATFPNNDLQLWPGQYVKINLPSQDLPQALLIPARAVQQGQTSAYVYVAKSDDTAEYREISTGPTIDNMTVVTKGLKAGEQVVTDGQLRLSDGTPIRIVN